MRRYLYAFIAFILVIAAGVIFTAHPATGNVAPIVATAVPITEKAVVKVVLPNGLGSGVALDNGFIVTAAHVVKASKVVSIKTRDGRTASADVLWASAEYDIALLKTAAVVPAASLSCETAAVGDDVMAIGNPLGLEFISSFGRVAGEPREFLPNWKSAFITDLTVIMGNSGGPMFSPDGKVVGIVVGVAGAPSEGAGRSYLGFSFVVPSSAVCKLMGRVV